MTLREVASTFHSHGYSAAKRYSHMSFGQHTHLPDKICSVEDKVRTLHPPYLGSPSRSGPSGASVSPRSRTASPATRRPRSVPAPGLPGYPSRLNGERSWEAWVTPREGYDGAVGSHYEREPIAKGYGRATGELWAQNGFGDLQNTRLAELRPAFATATRAGSPERAFPVANSLREPVSSLREPVSSLREPVSSFREPASRMDYSSACGGAIGVPLGACSLPSQTRWQSTVGNVRFSETPSVSAAQFSKAKPEQKAASFVRIHDLLLRTHVASLAAALADDGWLHQHEREALCAQAREGLPAWKLAFLRAYSHFVELKDVESFVRELRALPACK